MKHILFIILSLAFFNVQAQDGEKVKQLLTDKRVPEVSINNLKGEKVNMAEYGKNGKVTVLTFWATWCAPCKKELASYHDLYDEWQEKYNLELVAISVDDSRNISNVKTYANGQGWDFNVLIDSNQELKRAMNFQTVPYTVLIDTRGQIVYAHNSYVPGDEYILEDKIKEIAGK